MKTIETVGKNIEKALQSGLAELGCKLDDVDVKILEHPGIFRKARVRLTYHGVDETVEKKTAASVMRNLEQRAAREANANAGDRKNRDRDNRDRAGQPKFQDRQNQQNQQNAQRQQRGDQPKQGAPVRGNEQSANAHQDKRQQPKSEFRRDFRAELETATAGEAKADKADRNDRNGDKRREPREAVSPEVLEAAKLRVIEYVRELTGLMGMASEVDAEVKEDSVEAIMTRVDDELVGTRGEVLDAIEHLATLAANGGDSRAVRVNLDCGGYRARMADALATSALEAADHAVSTGKRVELPAMTSSGRRVVHAALGEREDVITRSEGREPNRYIVIVPKRAGGNGGATNGNGGNNNNRRQGNGGGYNKKKHWNNRGGKPNGDNGAK